MALWSRSMSPPYLLWNCVRGGLIRSLMAAGHNHFVSVRGRIAPAAIGPGAKRDWPFDAEEKCPYDRMVKVNESQ
jgi:hypothetical protein